MRNAALAEREKWLKDTLERATRAAERETRLAEREAALAEREANLSRPAAGLASLNDPSSTMERDAQAGQPSTMLGVPGGYASVAVKSGKFAYPPMPAHILAGGKEGKDAWKAKERKKFCKKMKKEKKKAAKEGAGGNEDEEMAEDDGGVDVQGQDGPVADLGNEAAAGAVEHLDRTDN